MALHKIYIRKRRSISSGFTLIELLVVVGLITVLMSLTLFFDIHSFRGDAFRSERDTLISTLQTARANALNNINQSRHGVKINPSGYQGYVLFEGDTYATSDPISRKHIPSVYAVTLEGTSPDEVVFSHVSGDANYDGAIVLIDPYRLVTTGIQINHEGSIGW